MPEVEVGLSPYKQAWAWLDAHGTTGPTSESKFRAWLSGNNTAAMLLVQGKPLLAEKLGLEMDLPPSLLRLETSGQPASVKLGRELLDLGIDVEDIIKLVPTKATTIRLSIKLWNDDQVERMQKAVDDARLVAASGRESTQASIREAGAPLPRGAQVNRLAKEKQYVRAGRAAGSF